MEVDLVAWLNLSLRWLHVITGICWIGASFYFVWLDNHLRPAKEEKKGVAGELWAVHGGGFYHNQKYLVAPEEMPDELHWFKWEAYFTWISGFLLLALMYYYGAEIYLIDKSKIAFAPYQATLVGLAFLVAGWLIYDLLCKSPLGESNRWFGIVWFLVLTGFAYALTEIFSDRGAFIHVGAIIGTVMAANVFMIIIPNQRKVVASLAAGEAPDPNLGKAAKQRSVHNNYMTLPVLFIMISNHYPMTFGNSMNWLVLAGIGLSGVVIRHYFMLRHAGKDHHGYIAAGVGIMLLTMLFAAAIDQADRPDLTSLDVPTWEAMSIVQKHCVSCHAAAPTHPDFSEAPVGMILENEASIRQHAAQIMDQAVLSDLMPMANETGMTDLERQKLGTWLLAGENN